MIQEFMHSIMTFLDLMALSVLIGAAWCDLWLARRPTGEGMTYPKMFLERLRRLLMVCLTVLVISSFAGLVQRSTEMSGVGVTAIFPVLPTVIFKTHYGRMWLLRLAGLFAAWVVWWAGRRHIGSRLIAAFLLSAGAVIAFSRSASGHPADFGDLSPQQLADLMHLPAVSSWGGVLVALALIFPPPLVEKDSLQQQVVAGIADRFYVSFGPVLSVLVLAGLYNAWFAVGSFQLMVTTPYGGLLSAKLVFLLLLAFRYIVPPGHGQDESRFAIAFLRRTRIEAIIVVGVLLCVAVLVHQIPSRHYAHLAYAGLAGSHAHHEAQGPEPDVSLETNITAGIPVTLTVRIMQTDGNPLKGLEISHERILHAIIIGKDLNAFAHIHPEDIGPVTDDMMKKSTFPLLFTFPKAGEYLVGLDFAAADEYYSKTLSLNVAGGPAMGEPTNDFSTTKNFGEYRVALTISPENIRAGKETTLRYIVEKDGKAVTDLEPFLGASMHLAVVSADLKRLIHVHGVTPGEPHLDHLHAAPPERFGPEIDTDLVFPVKGIYKIFSQVKHQGKVLLFDFMVNVQ